jgi:hypothetical protein
MLVAVSALLAVVPVDVVVYVTVGNINSVYIKVVQ